MTPWTLTVGDGPLVATAIHAGHDISPEALELLAVDEPARLREEDPHTERLTTAAPTRVVVHRSRFEVDLNRPRTNAVYLNPEDAWGIQVWKQELPAEAVDRSLQLYDEFYATMEALLTEKTRLHGQAVVYDIHSYNHRRDLNEPEDGHSDPEVNLGTGSMDRERWSEVVEAFVGTLSSQQVNGHPLDVRENVRFTGGNLAAWTHRKFPHRACVLAIEFKKTFMDEWTGETDFGHMSQLEAALTATMAPVLEATS